MLHTGKGGEAWVMITASELFRACPASPAQSAFSAVQFRSAAVCNRRVGGIDPDRPNTGPGHEAAATRAATARCPARSPAEVAPASAAASMDYSPTPSLASVLCSFRGGDPEEQNSTRLGGLSCARFPGLAWRFGSLLPGLVPTKDPD